MLQKIQFTIDAVFGISEEGLTIKKGNVELKKGESIFAGDREIKKESCLCYSINKCLVEYDPPIGIFSNFFVDEDAPKLAKNNAFFGFVLDTIYRLEKEKQQIDALHVSLEGSFPSYFSELLEIAFGCYCKANDIKFIYEPKWNGPDKCLF